MKEQYDVGIVEEVITDIVEWWGTLRDITKQMLSLIVYTWFVFFITTIFSIGLDSWYSIPYFITCICGFIACFNAEKW